jgi:hypothetical protein
MFIAVYVVDMVMARIHLRPEATILDDLLLGLLAAVLVVSLEKQHEREIRLQKARIGMIIEMNHHIRNALQSIVYASAGMEGENAKAIRDASRRVEWALKEVLPAENASAKSYKVGDALCSVSASPLDENGDRA